MKNAKFLSLFFGAVAALLIVAAAAGYICFHQAPPMILTPVEEADGRTEMLMEAICRGDYTGAAESLYGQPELQWNRETASELGALLWQAYSGSMSYAFAGPCYATESGICRDVTVTVLDIPALGPKLQEQVQLRMKPYLTEARYDSAAFDKDGNLRPEFAAEILNRSVEQVLRGDNAYVSYPITLELVFQNGQWWVVPTRALVDIVAGVVTP